MMLSKGANVNAVDGEAGWNVLHFAAESGDPSMVYFIIQATNVHSTLSLKKPPAFSMKNYPYVQL